MAEVDILNDDFRDVPVLEMDAYRWLVQEIPPPTDEQIREFATFVSDAKSWYKHLPAFGPGVPFQFFVDPGAGMDRVRLPGRVAAFFERTPSVKPFHYTWMTTETYRTRFGCLAFCSDHGSEQFLDVTVPLVDGTELKGYLDNNPSRPVVHVAPDQPYRLPTRVLEEGRAQVTGIVHQLASTVWFWRGLFANGGHLPWPEGAGGEGVITKIRERCDEVTAESLGADIDPVLEALVKPQRERLQAGMVAAMERMRALVYES